MVWGLIWSYHVKKVRFYTNFCDDTNLHSCRQYVLPQVPLFVTLYSTPLQLRRCNSFIPKTNRDFLSGCKQLSWWFLSDSVKHFISVFELLISNRICNALPFSGWKQTFYCMPKRCKVVPRSFFSVRLDMHDDTSFYPCLFLIRCEFLWWYPKQKSSHKSHDYYKLSVYLCWCWQNVCAELSIAH